MTAGVSPTVPVPILEPTDDVLPPQPQPQLQDQPEPEPKPEPKPELDPEPEPDPEPKPEPDPEPEPKPKPESQPHPEPPAANGTSLPMAPAPEMNDVPNPKPEPCEPSAPATAEESAECAPKEASDYFKLQLTVSSGSSGNRKTGFSLPVPTAFVDANLTPTQEARTTVVLIGEDDGETFATLFCRMPGRKFILSGGWASFVMKYDLKVSQVVTITSQGDNRLKVAVDRTCMDVPSPARPRGKRPPVAQRQGATKIESAPAEGAAVPMSIDGQEGGGAAGSASLGHSQINGAATDHAGSTTGLLGAMVRSGEPVPIRKPRCAPACTAIFGTARALPLLAAHVWCAPLVFWV